MPRIGGHNDRRPIPQRPRPRSAQSGAVRTAHDPRASARQQGVSMIDRTFQHPSCRLRILIWEFSEIRPLRAATSSLGVIRPCRASKRTGWVRATTVASAAWTPCPWRPATKTNGSRSDWSTTRWVPPPHCVTRRFRLNDRSGNHTHSNADHVPGETRHARPWAICTSFVCVHDCVSEFLFVWLHNRYRE